MSTKPVRVATYIEKLPTVKPPDLFDHVVCVILI